MDEEIKELFEKIDNNEYFNLPFKILNKLTPEQEKYVLGKFVNMPNEVIRKHQKEKLGKLILKLENRAYTYHGEVSLTADEIQDVWKNLNLLNLLLSKEINHGN